ncbi:hypothetical protein Fcan01_19044 [Folsomia candida]|uniref:Uncharacterized protein n=1 Tax=Folsomia candida TaxID=158441 RepID=A0A226DL42_FOLCA|nr:hypothetical protein Fcan01_19044 [Folsomia candida]
MFELNTPIEHNELLDFSWEMHNFNLRGLQTRGSRYSKFDPETHTCSAIQRGGKRFIVYTTCMQLALGGKFNFTDVKISGVQSPHSLDANDDFVIDYFYATKSGIKRFMYPATAERTWMPHCGQRLQLRMATVAIRRHKLIGLKALAMPLDWYTWAASGISFTFLAIFLSIIAFRDHGKLKNTFAYFIQTWGWILSCLSAQYHGTPGISRLLPNFPVLIIICAMCFFLLGTVFYQGSMFSSLIARTPPDLPSNLESVVDSKIPIITTSAYYETHSLLKSLIIDDVISTTNKSSKSFHTLTELKAKTIFLYSLRRLYMSSPSGFIIGLNISKGYLQFDNKVSARVMDTFAIVNVELDLEETLAGVGVENIATARIFGAKKEMIFDEAEQVPLSALENIFVLCASSDENRTGAEEIDSVLNT